MKVYFNHNFWSRENSDVSGIPKLTDWKFTHDGTEYFIPKIYQFQEGITLDLINILDNEKLMAFYDKYAPVEHEMDAEEIAIAEHEKPIPELHLKGVFINGHPTEVSSSSVCRVSFLDKKMDATEFLNEIKKEYNISNEESFQFIRIHAKYTDEAQKEMSQLRFLMANTEELIPVRKRFIVENTVEESQYDVIFQHPLTGEEHHLYMASEFKDARNTFPHYDRTEPHNFVILEYELVPPLPKDEHIAIQEIRQMDINDGNAAAIGFIFSDKKTGIHGYAMEHDFSSMYWKELDYAEFSIVGIKKVKCNEGEIEVLHQ